MICHYEVLGLTLDCSDDEIKKTYRRLALIYHPDKNPDNHDECTKKFLLIQQAYEVLIDPQERAWYDKHRSAILKGGLGKGDQYEDKSLDVYQYFNSGCYSGFDDDIKSFYTVYASVFKLISEEDVEFMEPQSYLKLAPEFGNSQSSYEKVVGEFYAYWECYNTIKSYVWVEKYDTRDAPNRQVRRMMEQDNKKLRDAAKRERNEQIRTLVAFVKKRDKRVQSYNQKLRERADEINRLTAEKKEQKRIERLKMMEDYKESGWSATSELEDQLRNLELDLSKQFGEDEEYSSIDEADENDVDDDDGDDFEKLIDADVDEDDDTFCVACNKTFKSKKAMENHCNSKKHQEKISMLIQEMKAEENGQQNSDESDECESQSISNYSHCNTAKSKSKKQKKKRRKLKSSNTMKVEDEKENTDDNDFEQNVSSPIDNRDDIESKIESGSANVGKKDTKIAPNSRKDSSAENRCNSCQEAFSTRNKLFDHLKISGHVLRIETENHTDKINRKQIKIKNKTIS